MKTHARHLIGAVAILALLIVMLPGPLQSTDSEQVTRNDSSGVSVGKFLTPDGRFDLEATRRSCYQGPLDMKGFRLGFDSISGQSVFRPMVPDSPADHPDDIYWSPMSSGMNNDVYALTVYDNQLIAGGEFAIAGGVTASRIAAWDPVAAGWSPLGLGMGGGGHPEIYALTVYDNTLIAGGTFTTAGGVAANYIAAWDGSSWSPLGSGMNASVVALTVYDDLLIAGGEFTTAGEVAANGIAAWNGSSWSPLGSGLNGWISALTVYDNKLIAGGGFTIAGSVWVNYITAWDGSSWSPLGSGMNSYVIDLTVYNNRLIAGGYFTTAGGVAANYIAAWDGSSWSPLGSGMNDWIWALTVYDNQLIAGGYYTTAGGVAANRIAAWDGSSWLPLGSGMNDWVWALTVYDNKSIAGGEFTMAGSKVSAYVARWTKGFPDGILSETGENQPPAAFDLKQNYPNPFNSATAIDINTETSSRVTLTVYDALGRRVRGLVDGILPGGPQKVIWDGTDDAGHTVSSGVYFYSVSIKGIPQSRKMVLLK